MSITALIYYPCEKVFTFAAELEMKWKAKAEGKRKEKYSAVKKGGGATDVTKKGGKGAAGGKVKVVDKRLKSDKRGEKNSRKKAGKKGGAKAARKAGKGGKKTRKDGRAYSLSSLSLV